MKTLKFIFQKIGLELLAALFFFIEWLIVTVILTYALRWFGCSEGTIRIVNTIWLLIAAGRAAARYSKSKRDVREAGAYRERVTTKADSVVGQNNHQIESGGMPSSRELVIQKLMAEEGMSRQQVEEELRKYGM